MLNLFEQLMDETWFNDAVSNYSKKNKFWSMYAFLSMLKPEDEQGKALYEELKDLMFDPRTEASVSTVLRLATLGENADSYKLPDSVSDLVRYVVSKAGKGMIYTGNKIVQAGTYVESKAPEVGAAAGMPLRSAIKLFESMKTKVQEVKSDEEVNRVQ